MMIIAACGGEAEFLDLSEEHREIAQRQAAAFDAQGLVHMIAICDAVARNAKASAVSRALFDAALARLAMSQHFADIPVLLSGQTPAAASASAGGRPAAEIEAKKKDPALAPNPALPRPAAPPVAAESLSPPRLVTEVKPAPSPPLAPVGATSVSPAPAADDQIWPRILEVAKEKFPDWQRVEHLVFRGFDGHTLRVGIDDSGADVVGFLNMQIDKIADLVKRATGRHVKIDLDTSSIQQRRAAPIESNAPLPEIVRKAADLFDASVVSVDAAP
jgi:hypothetical protein